MKVVNMQIEYLGRTSLDNWDCNEWHIELEYNDRQIDLNFYTGMALSEPTVNDVLASLFMDAEATDYNCEEWAENFGYDTDSRKAEQTYHACLEQAEKLNYLLGSDKEYFAELLEDY